MRMLTDSFPTLIAVAVMILAIIALPGWSRLVLLVPAAFGALWSILRLRRGDAQAAITATNASQAGDVPQNNQMQRTAHGKMERRR